VVFWLAIAMAVVGALASLVRANRPPRPEASVDEAVEQPVEQAA